MSDSTVPQHDEPAETGPALPPATSAPVEPVAAAQPESPPNPSDAAAQSVHPRSLKRRIEQQPPPRTAATSRIRSHPLPAPERQVVHKRVREPVPFDWEPEPMQGPWVAKPLVIGLAALAWLVALGLLLAAPERLVVAGVGARVLVPLSWGLAAALTFVPVQLRMALHGIGWQSIVGWALLGYLLAFVPAPTGWLLDLPDLPVYLLLFFAMFYTVTAAMVPLTYLLGQRFYKLRIHRLDVGRARRQAYEIGLLIVIALVMAGLRVLSPITFGLLALVMVLTEALLLSQVQPEG
ncbi:MAG: hypothetical protein M3R24_23965 [Chloroflexota bacterium]|nr:hypothetical protein [Chloroflexota bacterium]